MSNFSEETMRKAALVVKSRQVGVAAETRRRFVEAISSVERMKAEMAARDSFTMPPNPLLFGAPIMDDEWGRSSFNTYGGISRNYDPQRVVHMSEIASYPTSSPSWDDLARLTNENEYVLGFDRASGHSESGFFYNAYMNGLARPQGDMPQREKKAPVCVITPEEEAAVRPDPALLPRMTPQMASESVDEMTADLARKAEKLLGYTVLREKLKLGSPLAQALAKFEIEPFDQQAVEEYQEQAVLVRQRELKAAMMKRADFASLGQSYVNGWTMARWMTNDVEDYAFEIPMHALNLAVQIKEELPGAEFTIEHLADDPFLVVEYEDERYYLSGWNEPGFEQKVF